MTTRDAYISSLKSAFVTLATRATLTWAASLSPILGGPLFAKLVEYIARKLFSYIAEQSELAAFFFYIDTRVGEQSRDFEIAAIANWKAQQNGTKEEKEKAEKILWERFKVFASLKH